MSDHPGGAGTAVCLSVLGVPGKGVDDVCGQKRAIGRGQRGVLFTPEIVPQDQFAAILGEDQVDAVPLVVASE